MKNEGMEKGRRAEGVAVRLEVFQLYREMEYVITEVFPLTKYENVSIHTGTMDRIRECRREIRIRQIARKSIEISKDFLLRSYEKTSLDLSNSRRNQNKIFY